MYISGHTNSIAETGDKSKATALYEITPVISKPLINTFFFSGPPKYSIARIFLLRKNLTISWNQANLRLTQGIAISKETSYFMCRMKYGSLKSIHTKYN